MFVWSHICFGNILYSVMLVLYSHIEYLIHNIFNHFQTFDNIKGQFAIIIIVQMDTYDPIPMQSLSASFHYLKSLFYCLRKSNVVMFPSCSQWAFLIVLWVTLALNQFPRAIKAHEVSAFWLKCPCYTVGGILGTRDITLLKVVPISWKSSTRRKVNSVLVLTCKSFMPQNM